MYEEWRGVREGLEVSNLGRVRRSRDGFIYKPGSNQKGYLKLRLSWLGRSFVVHRLVAEAFCPNPHGKPCVNHIDANPKNNRADNLEWVTHKENNQHSILLGRTDKKGEKHHAAKLTEDDVIEIKRVFRGHDKEFGAVALANKYNVRPKAILAIVRGDNWGHVKIDKSGWISIDYRLPDEYKPVICYATEFDGVGFVTAGIRHEVHGFYVFNMDGEADTELRNVTHWMPMPNPPAG